jgi:poly-gamma-glutamate synthesis protein (capsule biosynthesis protein)
MGDDGARSTPRILKDNNIVPVGGNNTQDGSGVRVETVTKRGWKIGFIAATTYLNGRDASRYPDFPFVELKNVAQELVPVIKNAKAEYDLIVVLLHWGKEYAQHPGRYIEKTAKKLIDAGADIVAGTHPHVLQGVVQYKKGLIAYSLGNFLFENTHKIPRLTGILRVKVSKEEDKIESVVFHPAFIVKKPVKHPVQDGTYLVRRAKKQMIELSRRLKSTWLTVDNCDDIKLKLNITE